MEFTDGLNELYLGGQYRWILDRWTPYVGFGVGPVLSRMSKCAERLGPGNLTPSSISSTAWPWKVWSGSNTTSLPASRYSVTISSASASNDAELNGGGSLRTDVWTNHATFGVSYHFGGAPVPDAPY